MTQNDAATLVHAAGFLTGVALYAMLGVMALRAAASRPARAHPDPRADAERGPADRIPIATAVLGLLWNAGALVTYGFRDLGVGEPAPLLAAVSFCALGYLPAVVVHAALQGAARGPRVALGATAYAISSLAAALQCYAAVAGGTAPSRAALLLLTAGYAVVLALLALALRRQPGARGPLAAAALAAFAVMALHLSRHGQGQEGVAVELLGHHASLPLALVILYQDYRFALADIFLKRVLSLVALVAVAVTAYAVLGAPLLAHRPAPGAADPRATAGLLALWVGTALTYPALRRAVGGFVDRIVLRRADYARVRRDVEDRVGALEDPAAILAASCDALAPALSARRVVWRTTNGAAAAGRGGAPVAIPEPRRGTTTVRVVTADPPGYEMVVADLAGGRRLLSDDLAFLDAVALAVGRRIDAVRVAHERRDREAREHEMARLTTEAELRALRAQLNPHFLFNALTTVGQLMHEAPERAFTTLMRLTGLLRAVLRPSSGEFVTLAEEMEIVEAYLDIERARFEERLRVTIDVPADERALRLPPLVLQPLVENAVRHGIAPSRAGGEVAVWARAEVAGGRELLHLSVTDSGVGVSPSELRRRRASGIGLLNLEQRLARYFGDAGSLTVRSARGAGTAVDVRLPTERTERAAAPRAPGAGARAAVRLP